MQGSHLSSSILDFEVQNIFSGHQCLSFIHIVRVYSQFHKLFFGYLLVMNQHTGFAEKRALLLFKYQGLSQALKSRKNPKNIWLYQIFAVPLHHQIIVELKNIIMNNTDSNTGEIVMYELTNVKLLFITKDYLIILWRLNNCLVSLPRQKRAQTCWTKGITVWN